VVLKRLEFTLEVDSVLQVHEMIRQTLRTITSPLFNELVIWILRSSYPLSLLSTMNAGGWRGVDASLNTLAERNPGFGVTFRGDFNGEFGVDFGAVRRHIERDSLPLASLKGFVRFELVPNVENRFQKMGVL